MKESQIIGEVLITDIIGKNDSFFLAKFILKKNTLSNQYKKSVSENKEEVLSSIRVI